MKKIFKIDYLDCANCAAKMECGIKKLDGVIDAKISFMRQKLTIVAEDDKFDFIIKESEKIIKSIEPDCRISQ